ncbi:MAG: hypothetical protein KGZ53_11120 [Peptococcaceae bacterium]|nr:hypothetical protein [Peptococcaceae bacterium]
MIIVIWNSIGYDEASVGDKNLTGVSPLINHIFDKLVLFISCLAVYLIAAGNVQVLPIILVVSFSAFISYFEQRRFLRRAVAVYFLLSLSSPQLVYFLPLLFYDLMLMGGFWLLPLIALPMVRHGNRLPATGSSLTVLFLCVAWLMSQRTHTIMRLQSEYTSLRDTTKELLLSLESKNRELMGKPQPYEGCTGQGTPQYSPQHSQSA